MGRYEVTVPLMSWGGMVEDIVAFSTAITTSVTFPPARLGLSQVAVLDCIICTGGGGGGGGEVGEPLGRMKSSGDVAFS